MDPQTVPEGKPAKLNANTFTHASLVFGCWNTKADGSGTSYADTAAIKATEDTTLYAMWVDTFTVDVSTVLANRQQNVATTEGGLHPTVRKYVMVADGPVYSDPAMTQAVTTVSGSGTWKNVAYNGGNGYALNASGSGQTYYKDEDTSVIVIYQIYYGAWSSALVKQDAMSSWGNPSAAGFDKSLYTSIGISTNVWSGTPAIGNNMGRMLSVGSGYWSVDVTSETWSRIQTSLFK